MKYFLLTLVLSSSFRVWSAIYVTPSMALCNSGHACHRLRIIHGGGTSDGTGFGGGSGTTAGICESSRSENRQFNQSNHPS